MSKDDLLERIADLERELADRHSQPWDFATAVARCRAASRDQARAEEIVAGAYRDKAEKEERYRKALATEQWRLRNEDDVAWSSLSDLARGNENVARLRRELTDAEGLVEVAVQAAWRRNADRKDAQRFADWSQRRELAEGYGQVPDPDPDREAIGARR